MKSPKRKMYGCINRAAQKGLLEITYHTDHFGHGYGMADPGSPSSQRHRNIISAAFFVGNNLDIRWETIDMTDVLGNRDGLGIRFRWSNCKNIIERNWVFPDTPMCPYCRDTSDVVGPDDDGEYYCRAGEPDCDSDEIYWGFAIPFIAPKSENCVYCKEKLSELLQNKSVYDTEEYTHTPRKLYSSLCDHC